MKNLHPTTHPVSLTNEIAPKRAYSKPQLVVYGDIRTLTQVADPSGGPDATFSSNRFDSTQ